MKTETIDNNTHALFQFFDDSSLQKRDEVLYNEVKSLGLPHRKSEEYKHSPVDKFLKGNIEALEIDSTPYSGSIDADLHFFNGKLVSDISKLSLKGLEVKPLEKSSVSVEDHAILKDSFQLLNQALFTDGIQITYSDKTEKGSISILHEFSKNVISLPRVEVKVESGCEFSIMEKYRYSDGCQPVLSPSMVAVIAKNARLKTWTMQTLPQCRPSAAPRGKTTISTARKFASYPRVVKPSTGSRALTSNPTNWTSADVSTP